MPHTEHKHHFQNVKENAATTYIIIIIIIIIVGIGFSMKVYLLTDLEPTHCIWTMPSLNGDNSHNNWGALFLNFRDKDTNQ